MKQLTVIEVRPEIRRLLERLAKQGQHQGVTPSLGAVVATLAEAEAARRKQADARAHDA